MNPQIKMAVQEFVTDDDKTDLFVDCYEIIKFMMDYGIPLESAALRVKNVVRTVRDCYGD